MEIKIKNRKGEEYIVLIDEEDYNKVKDYSWRPMKHGYTCYAITQNYAITQKETIYMHRLILNINDTNIKIDHIDGNGLNNQKYNIRICTQNVNLQNRRSWGKSGYKGVTKYTQSKWKTAISYNKQCITIGIFNTIRLAAISYNIKAKELYNNNYVKLNDIIPTEEELIILKYLNIIQ